MKEFFFNCDLKLCYCWHEHAELQLDCLKYVVVVICFLAAVGEWFANTRLLSCLLICCCDGSQLLCERSGTSGVGCWWEDCYKLLPALERPDCYRLLLLVFFFQETNCYYICFLHHVNYSYVFCRQIHWYFACPLLFPAAVFVLGRSAKDNAAHAFSSS